jgi:hypothetical protein
MCRAGCGTRSPPEAAALPRPVAFMPAPAAARKFAATGSVAERFALVAKRSHESQERLKFTIPASAGEAAGPRPGDRQRFGSVRTPDPPWLAASGPGRWGVALWRGPPARRSTGIRSPGGRHRIPADHPGGLCRIEGRPPGPGTRPSERTSISSGGRARETK